MPSPRRAVRLLLAVVLLAGPGVVASAQGHGGGPGGPGGGPGMGPGGPGFGNVPPGGLSPDSRGGPPPGSGKGDAISSMRGGLQLGPPGKWWDDKHFAKDLGLSSEQQKRMDGIFSDNRGALVSRLQALQDEESKMETLSRTSSLDEATLFAQIDRLAEARASLEKANAHMLLSIRHEMSADQIARLDSHR